MIQADRYIRLDVKQETSTIVLNTADLDLSNASIYSDALKKEQAHTSLTSDTIAERATLQFATPLPAGSKAQLQIGFQGKLTGSMLGYYRSAWEVEGKTKYYALTQFEVRLNFYLKGLSSLRLPYKPTAARRAFPCWDEPLLKATFAITLISRADTVNLSNMPAASEEIYKPDVKDTAESDMVAKSMLQERNGGSPDSRRHLL